MSEPLLNFSRLGGSVASILDTDTEITCAAVHPKYLIYGTNKGAIHVVDYSGQEVRKINAHTARINDIAIDESGDWFLTAADDNRVAVTSVTSDDSHEYLYHRPIRAARMYPDFHHLRDKPIVNGGDSGKLRLVKRKKLAFNSTVNEKLLFSDEGNIYALELQPSYNQQLYPNGFGVMVAWCNDSGVKVYDIDRSEPICYIAAPQDSPPINICPPRIIWVNENTLYIGWADQLRIMTMKTVQVPPAGGENSKAPPTFKNVGSVTHRFRLDAYICGIIPYGEFVGVLTYQPGLSTDEIPSTVSKEKAMKLQLPVIELRFYSKDSAAVNPTNLHLFTPPGNNPQNAPAPVAPFSLQNMPLSSPIERTVLSFNGLSSSSTPAQIRLVAAPDVTNEGLPLLFCVSPQDVICGQPRVLSDHIAWELELGHINAALAAALATPEAVDENLLKSLKWRFLASLFPEPRSSSASLAVNGFDEVDKLLDVTSSSSSSGDVDSASTGADVNMDRKEDLVVPVQSSDESTKSKSLLKKDPRLFASATLLLLSSLGSMSAPLDVPKLLNQSAELYRIDTSIQNSVSFSPQLLAIEKQASHTSVLSVSGSSELELYSKAAQLAFSAASSIRGDEPSKSLLALGEEFLRVLPMPLSVKWSYGSHLAANGVDPTNVNEYISSVQRDMAATLGGFLAILNGSNKSSSDSKESDVSTTNSKPKKTIRVANPFFEIERFKKAPKQLGQYSTILRNPIGQLSPQAYEAALIFIMRAFPAEFLTVLRLWCVEEEAALPGSRKSASGTTPAARNNLAKNIASLTTASLQSTALKARGAISSSLKKGRNGLLGGILKNSRDTATQDLFGSVASNSASIPGMKSSDGEQDSDYSTDDEIETQTHEDIAGNTGGSSAPGTHVYDTSSQPPKLVPLYRVNYVLSALQTYIKQQDWSSVHPVLVDALAELFVLNEQPSHAIRVCLDMRTALDNDDETSGENDGFDVDFDDFFGLDEPEDIDPDEVLRTGGYTFSNECRVNLKRGESNTSTSGSQVNNSNNNATVTNVFSLIRKYQLYSHVGQKVLSLMRADVTLAMHMLVDFTPLFPPFSVISQLEGHPRLELQYLELLWERYPLLYNAEAALSVVHNRHLLLLGRYLPNRVLDFLRFSERYNKELALRMCSGEAFRLPSPSPGLVSGVQTEFPLNVNELVLEEDDVPYLSSESLVLLSQKFQGRNEEDGIPLKLLKRYYFLKTATAHEAAKAVQRVLNTGVGWNGRRFPRELAYLHIRQEHPKLALPILLGELEELVAAVAMVAVLEEESIWTDVVVRTLQLESSSVVSRLLEALPQTPLSPLLLLQRIPDDFEDTAAPSEAGRNPLNEELQLKLRENLKSRGLDLNMELTGQTQNLPDAHSSLVKALVVVLRDRRIMQNILQIARSQVHADLIFLIQRWFKHLSSGHSFYISSVISSTYGSSRATRSGSSSSPGPASANHSDNEEESDAAVAEESNKNLEASQELENQKSLLFAKPSASAAKDALLGIARRKPQQHQPQVSPFANPSNYRGIFGSGGSANGSNCALCHLPLIPDSILSKRSKRGEAHASAPSGADSVTEGDAGSTTGKSLVDDLDDDRLFLFHCNHRYHSSCLFRHGALAKDAVAARARARSNSALSSGSESNTPRRRSNSVAKNQYLQSSSSSTVLGAAIPAASRTRSGSVSSVGSHLSRVSNMHFLDSDKVIKSKRRTQDDDEDEEEEFAHPNPAGDNGIFCPLCNSKPHRY